MIVNAGFGDEEDLYGDEGYNDGSFGRSFRKTVSKAIKAPITATKASLTSALAPVKTFSKSAITIAKNPFAVKKNLTNAVQTSMAVQKEGRQTFHTVDNIVASLNPADHFQQKLDTAGQARKAPVARILGRTGETVRTHPIETVAIVYGSVLASEYVGAGAGGDAGSSGAGSGGAGAGGASAGSSGIGTSINAGLNAVKAGYGYVVTGAGLVKQGQNLLNKPKPKPQTGGGTQGAGGEPQPQDNSTLYMMGAAIAAKLLLFS